MILQDPADYCGNCGQASALDFLEGDPPLCFYCSNRRPLNLDPEGEENFRREVQPVVPFKYRLSSCRIARSPHHLAFYIKPLLLRRRQRLDAALLWEENEGGAGVGKVQRPAPVAGVGS